MDEDQVEVEEGVVAEDDPAAILEKSDLAILVMLRDQIQKLRIAENNRHIAATKLDDARRADLHGIYHKRLHDLEQEIERDVKPEMQAHPAWEWLSQIKGVAELSSALVVSYIDIERANTVSALWRYAGFGVNPETGERDRLVKGQPATFNRKLKTMVWRLIANQIRLSGPYARMYRQAKHTYLTTRGPDSGAPEDRRWTLGHCEQAARRKAAKLFLSHLWEVWRRAEGLPVREAFSIAKGIDHDKIDPWKYIQE